MCCNILPHRQLGLAKDRLARSWPYPSAKMSLGRATLPVTVEDRFVYNLSYQRLHFLIAGVNFMTHAHTIVAFHVRLAWMTKQDVVRGFVYHH